MHRPCLLIALTLGAAACAQIAGFEQLSSKKAGEPGAGGTAGVAVSGGSSTDGDGLEGGESTSGGSGNSGGNVNIGNNAGATAGGGRASGGGAGGSAGSGGAAGGGGGSAGAEVVGGCNREQLANRHFDAGPVGWRQESTAPGILAVDDVIVEKSSERLAGLEVMPQSGNYLGWFGGRPNSEKSTRVNLLQRVDIPANISRLVVSGWIWIRTTEPVVAESNDQLDVALQNDSDFWSFHVWYVDAAEDEWQWFEYEVDNTTVLDELRGNTLDFIVESKTDTSFETHFWLDSLSFIAECP